MTPTTADGPPISPWHPTSLLGRTSARCGKHKHCGLASFQVFEYGRKGVQIGSAGFQIIPKKSPATQKNPSLKYYKLRDFTSTIPIFLKIFQNNRCSRTRVFTHACLNSLNRAFNMCLLNSIGLRTTGLG